MYDANENVWIGTKRIKEALIRFKVKNSWLENNKISSNDVRITRWDGKWSELGTTEIIKDNTYTYYEAKTSSLSSFAIIAPQPQETIPATTTPAVTSTQPGPAGTQPVTAATQGTAPSTNLWLIAVVIIVLVAAVVVYFKRRK